MNLLSFQPFLRIANGFQCSADYSECLAACNNNSDCRDTHYCKNSECQLKQLDGSSCNLAYNGADCESGYCDGSSEGPATALCCQNTSSNECCQQDSDCPANYLGRASAFNCVNGSEGSACDDYGDCHTDTYCTEDKACNARLQNGEIC